MASWLLAFSAVICMLSFSPVISQQINTYIVHVSSNAASSSQLAKPESHYLTFLPKDTKGSSDASRLVHSYRSIIRGFAARLSADEAKSMENMEGVLSIKPQRILSLQTTHSPNFLGLQQNTGFWPNSNFGEGVIVGLLDTGITPGHPSFDDQGMPPPPAKWKGKCELDASACNNKLIGARNFVSSGEPGQPIDDEGHGTHTASTAAGNFVPGANVFGNAKGTAVGMAPRAHIAMYKVCSADGCAEVDMLAAMDAAIEEGVDVLSLSLGGPPGFVVPFFTDSIAIGAFTAIQKGIFVSCSASNSGPASATLSNEAPWILTVGASTIDRNIRTTVVLGNNDQFDGESLFQPISFSDTMLPLVFPGQNGDPNATFCAPGSLNPADVQGKVVICERGGEIGRIDKGTTVKLAGGAAMILVNQEVDGDSTFADAHVLPASHVGFSSGEAIKTFANSTLKPTATISFKGTIIGVKNAPSVTSFSSRGPSLASPGILKPDIIGPEWNRSIAKKCSP